MSYSVVMLEQLSSRARKGLFPVMFLTSLLAPALESSSAYLFCDIFKEQTQTLINYETE